ncbi:Alpha/Beta hydrolase protein, partial [Powellomyces hirtus]
MPVCATDDPYSCAHRLAGAVIVYRQTHSNAENTCTNEHGLETYLLISVLTLMLEVGVELAIAWISLQGTVSDDRPRRHMDKAIYVHSTLILLELSAQIFGLSLLWGSNPVTCPNAKGTGLIVHLLIYISTAGLLLYTFLVLLLFLRSTPLNVESIDHAAIWRTRLGCVFFSHKRKQPLGDAGAGDGDVLTDVARVFAEFLEDAETVPSDILVGVILLRRKQKHHRDRVGKERRTDLDDPPCNPQHPTSSPVTYKELAAITYFYQYAESIYGLPLYMFNNFARGAYHLCCPCTRVAPETAVEAVQVTASASSWFCCFPTTPTPSSAELADQMLPHADIIYVSLHGGLFRSPFVVCFDHPRQTVVIAVRGTLSTADVLVDLNCDLTEIQLPGGLTAQTHSGMYRTARNLLDELNTTGVLRRILLSEDSQYKSYKILTTGHSLGGGVSSLLAFLLAQHFPSHNTRCIAYSPPGCMITASAIPHFRTFCTSVIMGLDIVPRLNRNTLESLKKDVGRCLRDCDVHKLKVLGGCFGKGM